MTAGLVAAVSEVKPEFPQMLEFEDPVPTGVGKMGLPGKPLEKAAHRKVPVYCRLGPFCEDLVAGGVGHKPVGPVSPHIDGDAF